MKKSVKLFLWAAIPLLALLAAVYILLPPNGNPSNADVNPNTGANAAASGSLQTTTYKLLESPHIKQGTKVTYNSNPPTSGPHFSSARAWGVYNTNIADEGAVHNLEHGGIWITYRPDLDPKAVSELRKIAARYPKAVLMSPRAKDDSPIAIVSWGRLMKLKTVDTPAIDLYIRTYINNSPEKLASLGKTVAQKIVAPVIGKTFPAFSLTDVDGAAVSLSTLSGKPTLVWFTTSWCVPCQIGAKKVAKLDAKLGGDAFNVLVIFVDPRENAGDLSKWKKSFAAADWQVAFDDQDKPLSTEIGLKYLDSKYLLDAKGVLLNQDFRIADDAYLTKIRRAVDGS